MARQFASASSQWLYANTAALSADPITMAAWIYPDTAHDGTIMAITDDDQTSGRWQLVTNASSSVIQAIKQSSGGSTSQTISTTNTYSTSQWCHVAAAFVSTGTRYVYLNADDANKGSGFTGVGNEDGASMISIGARKLSSTSVYFNGRIAHAAIWNAALTSAEVTKLYAGGIGVDPRSVRPDSLVAYWPLLNNDGDQDYWGNFHLTASGSPTYAQHPPVLMRSRPKYVILGAAGGAPTISSVTITGTRTVSNTLTANVVTVPGTVDSIAYQWEIADDGSGTNAADLSGETAQTLALTYADFASRLDANGEAYVRVGAIATEGVESSAESFSDWVRVTAGGSGVVRPIGQSVYISV